MGEGFRALCNDFYINQKVSVKLDLPRSRETVLDLFERLRREFPAMQSFKRYKDELALESAPDAEPHRWLAIRASTIRSGVVNPDSFDDAYGLHQMVLDTSPYFLTISPLDIEYIELLYGFDVLAPGNHDAIVASALLGDSPLSRLAEHDSSRPIDFQPVIGLALDQGDGLRPIEAHFEVKTRSPERAGRSLGEDPISIYLTLRLYDPVTDVKALGSALERVRTAGEALVHERLVPGLLAPIRSELPPDPRP